VDVIARFGFNVASNATLRLTGAFNANETRVTRVSPTPSQLAGFEETLFGRVERGRIEVGQPKNALNLSAVLSTSKLGVMARTVRFGEVTSRNVNPANDQTYDAKWITDLDVSYHLLRQLTVGAGANNLFDVYPEQVIPANNFNGILIYSSLSPFGFNGRYMYLRASYRL
jgi:iron complex outermembrane receptor protein